MQMKLQTYFVGFYVSHRALIWAGPTVEVIDMYEMRAWIFIKHLHVCRQTARSQNEYRFEFPRSRFYRIPVVRT